MKLEETLKISRFSSEEQRAALSIIYTAAWLNDRINTMLKVYGISEQQFNVLNILRGQDKKPANLDLIRKRMMHKMSNTTRLVDKLRQKALVNQRACPHNRREVEITITQQGLDLLSSIEPARQEMEHGFFSNLTAQEVKQIANLMDKLRNE